jgi:mRNA-degrading endonuclease YafQ of YafQ-DinJ toxin-antitoxin module
MCVNHTYANNYKCHDFELNWMELGEIHITPVLTLQFRLFDFILNPIHFLLLLDAIGLHATSVWIH